MWKEGCPEGQPFLLKFANNMLIPGPGMFTPGLLNPDTIGLVDYRGNLLLQQGMWVNVKDCSKKAGMTLGYDPGMPATYKTGC